MKIVMAVGALYEQVGDLQTKPGLQLSRVKVFSSLTARSMSMFLLSTMPARRPVCIWTFRERYCWN